MNVDIDSKKAPVLFVIFLVAMAVIAVTFIDDLHTPLEPVFEWIESLGIWGVFWFIVIYATLIFALIPTWPFTLAAGFIFGFVTGTVYVVVSFIIGATIAFLLGRYFLRSAVEKRLHKFPRVERVSRGMGVAGWKVVMLARLVPFFPAKLSNYLLGVTAISLRDFIIGSFGVLPLTAFNVWLGSAARSLAGLAERDEPMGKRIALYGFGFIAASALVFYIMRMAQGKMDEVLEDPERQ